MADNINELRDEIFQSVEDIDPTLKRTSLEYMSKAVLFSAIKLGANEDRIAAVLGYEPEYVLQVGSRLRNSGIWSREGLSKKHVDAWCQEETGGIAFIMDSLVASGDMVVAGSDANGDLKYSMTESGKASIERKLQP